MESNENVVELNSAKQKENTSYKLESTEDVLEHIDSLMINKTNEDNAEEDIQKIFASLLTLDDDNFNILAPVFLEEFEKGCSNPAEIAILKEELKNFGISSEEMITLLENFSNKNFEKELEGQLSKAKIDFLRKLLATIINALLDEQNTVLIPVELCHEEAKIPTYANPTDSGMDIYALEDITVMPGETKLISTGLKVAIPNGYELQVRPKSGRALKTKLRVANTPGTIDSGYRDEIKVIIENIEAPIKDITYHFDDIEEGKTPSIIIDSILHGEPFYIGKGEKFAQLVLAQVSKASLFKVENVGQIQNDGRKGGFGSTGIK